MDLGAFRRNRTALLAWIVLPVTIIAVAYYTLHVYCRYVDESLQRRRAFMQVLPGIRHRLSVAGDVVSGFALTEGSRRHAFDLYQSRLGDLARQSGFVINSLRVEESRTSGRRSRDEADVRDPLVLRVKGEGALVALMKFLGDLQGPQSLTTVQGAQISVARLGTDPLYTAELLLRCDVVE